MFNKRETPENQPDCAPQQAAAASSPRPDHPTPRPAASTRPTSIGASISIEGKLKGDDDVLVEGRVKGTIELKKNTLTVGAQGVIEAEVFAHSIEVEGTVKGDLYAAERIGVHSGARIQGNIIAPRVSLEDGAQFQGAIDMDTSAEAFRKAFGTSGNAPARIAEAPRQSQTGGQSGRDGATGAKPQGGPSNKSQKASGGSAA